MSSKNSNNIILTKVSKTFLTIIINTNNIVSTENGRSPPTLSFKLQHNAINEKFHSSFFN